MGWAFQNNPQSNTTESSHWEAAIPAAVMEPGKGHRGWESREEEWAMVSIASELCYSFQIHTCRPKPSTVPSASRKRALDTRTALFLW